ncbi:MAG TPA: preprotein translocase subunit YajC [Candidatus Dietzia intestinipullorum]|nr:preprotein translocase subunit YajC [Candidatus Dietzia intestinipullorum]
MGLEILLPLMIIVLIVLMFVQSSKQRKAMKAMREMQDSLTAGDRVLTTSGLQATVETVSDDTVVLEIAPGVRTHWDRRVIRQKFDPITTSGDGSDGSDTSGSRTDASDQ